MEHYSLKTTGELRNILKKYGYRGYSDMDKKQLINSVFVAETEQALYKKFQAKPINFSQYSRGRCNAHRFQRFISTTDKMVLKVILFSGLLPEIDFKESDIEEYRWVAVYNKKNKDEIYIHTLLKLKNEFAYINLKINGNDKVDIKIAKDKDHKKIVNNIMTNEEYYWYRHATELRDQIIMIRNLNERTGFNFSKELNNLKYLYFKLQEEKNYRTYKIQDEDLKFDYMRNVDKLYWVQLNLHNNDKSYILYKSKDGVYTLIKFKYNMFKEEDIPRGELNMVKVYLSSNYADIISKALVYREYEMYMNQTELIRYF